MRLASAHVRGRAGGPLWTHARRRWAGDSAAPRPGQKGLPLRNPFAWRGPLLFSCPKSCARRRAARRAARTAARRRRGYTRAIQTGDGWGSRFKRAVGGTGGHVRISHALQLMEEKLLRLARHRFARALFPPPLKGLPRSPSHQEACTHLVRLVRLVRGGCVGLAPTAPGRAPVPRARPARQQHRRRGDARQRRALNSPASTRHDPSTAQRRAARPGQVSKPRTWLKLKPRGIVESNLEARATCRLPRRLGAPCCMERIRAWLWGGGDGFFPV